MGAIRIVLWFLYELNKWGMNLYWLLYVRWLLEPDTTWFFHFMGIMSFLYMVSNAVYILSGTEA